MSGDVIRNTRGKVHRPREHAAVRTGEYLFSQVIPYIGNKRKLLHLIARAVDFTGCESGTFVDLFTGSTVVARWAKKSGYRVAANDWEPYSYELALGTVVPNVPPQYAELGGYEKVFELLNNLGPVHGYIAQHMCPADDEKPDIDRERMFFTRENGERIDAIREQVASWEASGMLSAPERAYILASLIYAVSYASNTSGVFKGFHRGWGGQTGTALYRIRGRLTLAPPVLYDNGRENLAFREDAQSFSRSLPHNLGAVPEIVYIDPPYNQHPYGSNYHMLNTVTLWDKPDITQHIVATGGERNKSAIRTDWRTLRRSPYNHIGQAAEAFGKLIAHIQARWVLVSYSTDGTIKLGDLLTILARRGQVTVFTEKYKRYRVSSQRMSEKPHNVEFVAVLQPDTEESTGRVEQMVESILRHEAQALNPRSGLAQESLF